ncbi:MAG: ATP-dependent helicase, partial [Gemmatimonadetes bacterium]|nr:ATP-dependent helicase [Gemmatimonadota bacterium]
MGELRLAPCLTPHGRLLLAPAADAPELEAALAERLRQAFARGAGHGLLRLGGAEIGQVLPPVFTYWREFGSCYVTALCTRPDVEERRTEIPPPPAPPQQDLEALV